MTFVKESNCVKTDVQKLIKRTQTHPPEAGARAPCTEAALGISEPSVLVSQTRGISDELLRNSFSLTVAAARPRASLGAARV